MDRDPAQQSFRHMQLVPPLRGHMAQYAHRFERDLRADSIPGQYQNVEIHAAVLIRSYLKGLIPLGNQRHDLFVHETLLAKVGRRRKAVVQLVQFFPG